MFTREATNVPLPTSAGSSCQINSLHMIAIFACYLKMVKQTLYYVIVATLFTLFFKDFLNSRTQTTIPISPCISPIDCPYHHFDSNHL